VRASNAGLERAPTHQGLKVTLTQAAAAGRSHGRSRRRRRGDDRGSVASDLRIPVGLVQLVLILGATEPEETEPVRLVLVLCCTPEKIAPRMNARWGMREGCLGFDMFLHYLTPTEPNASLSALSGKSKENHALPTPPSPPPSIERITSIQRSSPLRSAVSR
jgi:hypothetical protein